MKYPATRPGDSFTRGRMLLRSASCASSSLPDSMVTLTATAYKRASFQTSEMRKELYPRLPRDRQAGSQHPTPRKPESDALPLREEPFAVVPGGGVEPPSRAPKARVLPLDDPGERVRDYPR